jgi:hypothetical protein
MHLISEVEANAVPSSEKSRNFNFMALYVHQLIKDGYGEVLVYATGCMGVTVYK